MPGHLDSSAFNLRSAAQILLTGKDECEFRVFFRHGQFEARTSGDKVDLKMDDELGNHWRMDSGSHVR